jgi:hypothetical protein
MTSEVRIAKIFTVPELEEQQPLDEDSLAEAWFAAHDTDQIDAACAPHDDDDASEPPRTQRRIGWQHAALIAFTCGVPMLAELFGPWGPTLPQHVQQIAARVAPVRTRSIPPPAPRVVETPVVTPRAAAIAQDDPPPAADLAIAEPAEPAAEETPRPARKPVARAVRVRSPDGAERAALKAQYQRVGRTLAAARRRLGAVAVAEVASRYRWIKLDAALATRTSRRLASSTLAQLQARLDALPAQRRAPHTVVLR